MRPDPLLQFRLGLAVIALIVIAGLVAAFAPQIFDRRHPAFAVFDNVAELTEGAAVHDQGFLIGRVTRIRQDLANRRFVVDVRLDPEWNKNDAQLSAMGLVIEQPNPLRPAMLSVVERPADEKSCPDKHFVAAMTGPQMIGCGHHPSLVEEASGVLNKANDTITQVEAMLKAAAPQGGAAGGGAASASMMTRVNATLDNVQALTQSARNILDERHQKEIGRIIHNLADVSSKANKTATQVNALVERNSMSADKAVGNLSYILSVTAASTASIANNLRMASENLRAISEQLRENPAALVKGRDLGNPSLNTGQSK